MGEVGVRGKWKEYNGINNTYGESLIPLLLVDAVGVLHDLFGHGLTEPALQFGHAAPGSGSTSQLGRIVGVSSHPREPRQIGAWLAMFLDYFQVFNALLHCFLLGRCC